MWPVACLAVFQYCAKRPWAYRSVEAIVGEEDGALAVTARGDVVRQAVPGLGTFLWVERGDGLVRPEFGKARGRSGAPVAPRMFMGAAMKVNS